MLKYLWIVAGIYLTMISTAWPKDFSTMRGRELIAAATALEEFLRDDPKAIIEKYTIEIHNKSENIEVMFIPDFPPSSFTPSGTSKLEFGGQTVFGREITYILSNDGRNILRKLFAR